MCSARIAFALALLLSAAATADDGRAAMAQGQKAYESEHYEEAIKSFRLAIAEHPGLPQAWYSLGLVHESQGQTQEAGAAFARAAQVFQAALAKDDANGDLWYGLGLCLEHQGKLTEETAAMQKAVERLEKAPGATATLAEAQNRVQYSIASRPLRAAPPRAAPAVNLGPGVNSPVDETFPQSSPDGSTIYFTSKREGGLGGEDIYSIEKGTAGWGAPERLPPPINTSLNDGAATFSGDGQSIIFTGCGRPDSLGSCDLYGATLTGTSWSKPKNLGPPVNTAAWEGQPALSPDGTVLIFASRRPGGLGKSDLWIAHREKKDGAWSEPVNLGAPVNTPFSEQSPYIAADGKTLYFASAGHPGLGRTDVFKTVFENGKWSEPVNLGAPINSEQDDKYFTIGGDGEVGYFASRRAGGYGGYDLYSAPIPPELRPEPTLIVTGKVLDGKGGAPLGAGVIIQELSSGELVSNEESNSATGKYTVVLPQGKTYSFSVSTPGFFFHSSKFEVPKGSAYSELTKNLSLIRIEKGAHVVLHNVFFATSKAELSSDSKIELGRAASLLKENPKMVVEVGGHTDNAGKPEANLKLSADRARVVREQLIAAGVPERRMKAKGYGQTVPVEDNKTEDGRSQNRRTELIVLDD